MLLLNRNIGQSIVIGEVLITVAQIEPERVELRQDALISESTSIGRFASGAWLRPGEFASISGTAARCGVKAIYSGRVTLLIDADRNTRVERKEVYDRLPQ